MFVLNGIDARGTRRHWINLAKRAWPLDVQTQFLETRIYPDLTHGFRQKQHVICSGITILMIFHVKNAGKQFELIALEPAHMLEPSKFGDISPVMI